MGAIFYIFPVMSSTQTNKNNPCFRWKNIHNSVLFPIRVPMELRTVFPTRGQQVSVRIIVFQEEPLYLQCLTTTLAIEVVESVSIYLDILTLGLWAIWEHPLSLPECMLIPRQLLVHHCQEVRKDIHKFCSCVLRRRRAVFSKDCTGPRVVHHNVSSEHDSAFTLRKFWFQLCIFEMTDVHQCSKVDFLFVSVCFQNNLLLAFDFLQLPGWNRLKFLPLLLQCCFRTRNFHRLRHRKKLWTKLKWVIELYPLPAMWSSSSFGWDDSTRCLLDSCASTIHACFVFGILLDSQLCASVSWGEQCLIVPFVHGINSSIGTSNFLLTFLVSSFSPSSGLSFGFSIAHSCFSLSFDRLFQFGSILQAAFSSL